VFGEPAQIFPSLPFVALSLASVRAQLRSATLMRYREIGKLRCRLRRAGGHHGINAPPLWNRGLIRATRQSLLRPARNGPICAFVLQSAPPGDHHSLTSEPTWQLHSAGLRPVCQHCGPLSQAPDTFAWLQRNLAPNHIRRALLLLIQASCGPLARAQVFFSHRRRMGK